MEDPQTNPLDIFKDVSDETLPSLRFNSLVLAECRFTAAQWREVNEVVKDRFTNTLKRVRIWDCGLVNTKGNLDDKIAQIFKTLALKEGLIELDIQQMVLGGQAISELAQLLAGVKKLKRLTIINDGVRMSRLNVNQLMSALSTNIGIQLESLVLYGLDLSDHEATRAMAHILGR